MVKILLKEGYTCKIDSSDEEKIKRHSWFLLKQGKNRPYARAKIGGKTITMHRFLLGLSNKQEEVDHINGDTLDNRRSNLRICSRSENNRNRRCVAPSSGFKGVSYTKVHKKFQAIIQKDRKKYHLGYFSDPAEAAKAYDNMALVLHGAFAVLNFRSQE